MHHIQYVSNQLCDRNTLPNMLANDMYSSLPPGGNPDVTRRGSIMSSLHAIYLFIDEKRSGAHRFHQSFLAMNGISKAEDPPSNTPSTLFKSQQNQSMC